MHFVSNDISETWWNKLHAFTVAITLSNRILSHIVWHLNEFAAISISWWVFLPDIVTCQSHVSLFIIAVIYAVKVTTSWEWWTQIYDNQSVCLLPSWQPEGRIAVKDNWDKNSSSYNKQEVKVIWQKAPHGGPIPPVRGHPRGSKFVPLNSWGRVSY